VAALRSRTRLAVGIGIALMLMFGGVMIILQLAPSGGRPAAPDRYDLIGDLTMSSCRPADTVSVLDDRGATVATTQIRLVPGHPAMSSSL
jgi:hypothetical protein